ncbi:MAG: hypothetical protein ACTTHM_07930 [Peptoanaerobacter stomatis]|uniref:hypothetical protein n=1 Tax=Peptoanaerobacter stomatis TaxID=796937 RepID=UPI003F9EFC82
MILESVKAFLNDISEFKVKKIKIQCIKNSADKNLIRLLNDEGFVLEFTAKSEFNGQDIEHYSYFLDTKKGDR